jgi:hypothetical protein
LTLCTTGSLGQEGRAITVFLMARAECLSVE